MRDVARQALRTVLPHTVRTVLVTAAVQALVVLTGIAPAPAAYQLVLTLLAALLIAAVTGWQVHLAPTGDRATAGGRHARALVAALIQRRESPAESLEDRWARHVRSVNERWRAGGTTAVRERTVEVAEEEPRSPRPALPPPSRRRIAVVALASAVLAVLLWLPIGPPGRVAFAAATFLVGYGAWALPVLPLLTLPVLPPGPRQPVPWRLLAKRWPATADLHTVASGALRAAREHVFTRPAGVILAGLGLLHLLRDTPGFGELAYRRAGGLVGMAVGGPLAWLCSVSGAIGLLCALLASAAVTTTWYLRPYRGRDVAAAALAVLLAVPLGGAALLRFVGYDYVLGTSGTHLVVLAGVSRHDRHQVTDTGVSTMDVPVTLAGLLRAGIPVSGRADGRRLAHALARPTTVKSYPVSGGDLAVGDCFTNVGPDAQLRYPAPCGAAHAGEVYFVGRLPVTAGRDVAAVARAMCEKPYGEYLGVPFGRSYLPIEAPMVSRDTMACWFRSVGPSSLRGAKVAGALLQGGWDSGPGCTVAFTDSLALTAGNARCLAPSKGHPETATTGILTVDATIGFSGTPTRFGLACVDGADLTSGYYAGVAADGSITLEKQVGAARTPLATGKPKRQAKLANPLDVHLRCEIGTDGVDITATAGPATVHAADVTQPVRRISARVFVDAPAAVTVTAFAATLA
jgi:hypothetical protein